MKSSHAHLIENIINLDQKLNNADITSPHLNSQNQTKTTNHRMIDLSLNDIDQNPAFLKNAISIKINETSNIEIPITFPSVQDIEKRLKLGRPYKTDPKDFDKEIMLLQQKKIANKLTAKEQIELQRLIARRNDYRRKQRLTEKSIINNNSLNQTSISTNLDANKLLKELNETKQQLNDMKKTNQELTLKNTEWEQKYKSLVMENQMLKQLVGASGTINIKEVHGIPIPKENVKSKNNFKTTSLISNFPPVSFSEENPIGYVESFSIFSQNKNLNIQPKESNQSSNCEANSSIDSFMVNSIINKS